MCLSIPAKLVAIEGNMAQADAGGNLVECSLALVEGVEVGDYVLIHTGFAIQKYDREEAVELLRALRDLLDEAS